MITDLHLDALENAPTAELQKNFDQVRGKIPKDIRERIRRLLEMLKKKNPDFVVITGDIINFVSSANIALLQSEIARSGLNVYWVPGNHDRLIPGPVAEKKSGEKKVFAYNEWEECAPFWEMVGGRPLSASFEQNGKCFIFLDNSDGKFKEDDLLQAAEFLDRNPDRGVFLFFHLPLHMPNQWREAQKSMGRWAGPPYISGRVDITEPSPIFPFLNRYGDRIEGVFAGHIHALAEDYWNGKFRQTTLEKGFGSGMFALVECAGIKPCRVKIEKALP